MPKHNNSNNGSKIAIITGNDISQDGTKKALREEGLLGNTLFSHNEIPAQQADAGIMDAHGLLGKSHECAHAISFQDQLFQTSPVLQTIQTRTGAKNLVLISCYGGAAMEDVRKHAESFEDATSFLIFSGSKNISDGLYKSENIAGVSAHFAQQKGNLATAFARQIPISPETMVYAEVIGGKLYEVKCASPKEAKDGKRENEIAETLTSPENWKNFMRNNLKFRCENGDWVKLTDSAIPEDFKVRAQEIQSALEEAIAPLSQPHLQRYKDKALFVAAHRNKEKRVSALIEAGANVNAVTPDGWTPLHLACEERNPEVVAQLLANGANIHAQDHQGRTPLHCACMKRNIAAATQLISAGAKLNVENKYGWTPLHQACANGYTDIVRTLMNHGADPYKRSFAMSTPPSELASRNGHAETVALLKEYKASHNNFHLACEMGNIRAVEKMLKKGVNINTRDEYGQTPMAIAKTAGNANIVALLEKAAEEEASASTHAARVEKRQTRSRAPQEQQPPRSALSCFTPWANRVREGRNTPGGNTSPAMVL